MSTSLRSGASGLQGLPCLKYYNVLKLGRRLTSGLSVTENTDFMKKCFKVKLFRIKFTEKKSEGAYVLSLSGVQLESPKDCHVEPTSDHTNLTNPSDHTTVCRTGVLFSKTFYTYGH